MPATLADLVGNETLLHFDVSLPGTIWADTAGTVAITDGTQAAGWDKTIGSLSGRLTDASFGPTYRDDYAASGYPALEFNGTNSKLGLASPGLVPFTRMYFLACITRADIATLATILSVGNSASHHVRLRNTSSTSVAIQAAGTSGGASSLLQSATIQASTLKMVIAGVIGGNHNAIELLDGASASATGPHISSDIADHLWVGARVAGDSQIFEGAFHEFAIISDACEWGQIIRAGTFMRHKWGVPDPSSAAPSPGSGGGFYNPFRNPIFGGT